MTVVEVLASADAGEEEETMEEDAEGVYASFLTPHCGEYWYAPEPSTMSWMP